jgi:hypothetical protein
MQVRGNVLAQLKSYRYIALNVGGLKGRLMNGNETYGENRGDSEKDSGSAA